MNVSPNRTRILDAAATVLPTNSAASMAEIAAVADVARTTVHRHFPTRQALLSALAARAIDVISATVDSCELDDGPVPHVLRRLTEALVPQSHQFRFLEVGPDVWQVGDLEKRWFRLADRLEGLVERGKRQGELREDIPTAWFVDLISSALWCAGESIDDGRVARADAPRLIVEVLLRGAGR